jgi:uncharacterized coiled-coil protein SlyX
MNKLSMYKIKKKRVIDPNAPPRPNLLSHEKVLKGNKETMEQQQQTIRDLQYRLERLESKLASQSAYLSQLHQTISRKNTG